MFKKVKQDFRALLEAPPGKRFQQQFHRRQQSREHKFLKRIMFIGGGMLVTAAGVFFLPAPGPGTVIIIIGLGLIAQESLRLSIFLDKLELLVRALTDNAQKWWKASRILEKIFVMMLLFILLGLIVFGSYWVFQNFKIP